MNLGKRYALVPSTKDRMRWKNAPGIFLRRTRLKRFGGVDALLASAGGTMTDFVIEEEVTLNTAPKQIKTMPMVNWRFLWSLIALSSS